jgi:hypothetical protein
VSEDRVLRKIFGFKREEVKEEWRRLCKEEFCDLYSSPHIIRVIKARKMRWVVYVERMHRGEAC